MPTQGNRVNESAANAGKRGVDGCDGATAINPRAGPSPVCHKLFQPVCPKRGVPGKRQRDRYHRDTYGDK